MNIPSTVKAIRTGVSVLSLAFAKGDNDLITKTLGYLDRLTRYAELGIDLTEVAAADTIERAARMDEVVDRGGVSHADLDALKAEMSELDAMLADQLEQLDAIAAGQESAG